MKQRKMKSPAENIHGNLLHVFIFLTHYIRGNKQCPSEQLNIPANKSNENSNAAVSSSGCVCVTATEYLQ